MHQLAVQESRTMSINLERFKLTRRAQRLRRYHTLPTNEQQTVGAHSFGVCMLLHEITGGKVSANLLVAALYHDVTETVLGDVPSPAYHLFPELKTAMANAEYSVAEKYDIMFELDTQEQKLLKIADSMEALFFCLEDYQRGNLDARLMVSRVTAGLLTDYGSGHFEDLRNPLWRKNCTQLMEYAIKRTEEIRKGVYEHHYAQDSGL
jgi:5'-deoxynucleotidase